MNLRWNNIDLLSREILFATQKTGRRMALPMHDALVKHFESLPVGDDPQGFICPSLAGKRSGHLSNHFREILVAAGLVQPRDHKAAKEGRDRKRAGEDLSFHCLRHTATSLLKNAGVSDVVARDLIGHESSIVSRNYTHLDTDSKRAAIEKLPEL